MEPAKNLRTIKNINVEKYKESRDTFDREETKKAQEASRYAAATKIDGLQPAAKRRRLE